MTHEEYKESIKKQQSLIRRLFKSRENRSKEIDKLTEEYYKDIIGKFIHVNPGDELLGLETGYYFIKDVFSTSNFIMSDRVEISVVFRRYGKIGFGDEISGVEIGFKNLYFDPDTDMKAKILNLVVPKEEGLSELKKICNVIIDNFTKI